MGNGPVMSPTGNRRAGRKRCGREDSIEAEGTRQEAGCGPEYYRVSYRYPGGQAATVTVGRSPQQAAERFGRDNPAVTVTDVECARTGETLRDAPALASLHERLNGRKPRPMRARRLPMLRDPSDVAWRWLRRFVGGTWYRGGSHVARLHFGPGIGFVGFRNDSAKPIRAVLTHERRAA